MKKQISKKPEKSEEPVKKAIKTTQKGAEMAPEMPVESAPPSEIFAESSKEIEGIKEQKIVDSIDFWNEQNKLSIRFSRKGNGMFRIQIYLNEETEIRPVTYTGNSTGYAFWNLLKGALKK